MLMIIGARGWEHKQWNGSFYEELLPQDWHLKYYSSNFNAALAPSQFWMKCSQEEVEEFCDDIPDDYPLIFELPNGMLPSSDNSDLDNAKKARINSDNLTTENLSTKNLAAYTMAKEIIPTWVTFEDAVWTKKEATYTITQAHVISVGKSVGKLKENAAVFKVSSSQVISDEEIKQVMLAIKNEFKPKSIEVTYLFFDDALVEVDTVNTAVTLLKMLVLDY